MLENKSLNYDATDPMRWFDGSHLPDHLQDMVKLFQATAEVLVEFDKATEHASDQAQLALQKLLEAKDAAVRALVDYEKLGLGDDGDDIDD
jgi:hypothetical protein